MGEAMCDTSTLAYTGDVTALLAVEVGEAPGTSSIRQWLLLAGLGSQLLAHHMPSGRRLCCGAVLPGGARVHGIHAAPLPSAPSTLLLAVHGDRHVVVLRLDWAAGRLAPLCVLPRCELWTMDVHISLAPGAAGPGPWSALLAVGFSDNSLEVYSVSPGPGGAAGGLAASHALLLRAEGAERCLLYSMAIQQRPVAAAAGGGGGAVQYWVGAGTVFLDVVVWASPPVGWAPAGAESPAVTAPSLYRLKGHEGSIHRVRWAGDGAQLASGSDDRTLRIWDIPAAPDQQQRQGGSSGATEAARELQPALVLFGHTARLWDCVFGRGLVFSVSEDCTWRAWDLKDGTCLATVEGHRGRGIWQCALLGPHLATGGADGSVKCWRAWEWLVAGAAPQLAPPMSEAGCLVQHYRLDMTLIDPGTAPLGRVAHGSSAGSDSRRPLPPGATPATGRPHDWVRHLALANGGSTAYVATTRGFLHRVDLPDEGAGGRERCHTVHASGAPIVALAALEEGDTHLLAFCDTSGRAWVLRLPAEASEGVEGVSATEWAPYGGRSALGVFWSGALGGGYVFACGLRGSLTLWRLPAPGPASGGSTTSPAVRLAEVVSPAEGRVLALHATRPEQGRPGMLACGDKEGCLTLWALPASALEPAEDPGAADGPAPLRELGCARRLHGTTPIRVVRVLPGRAGQPTLVATAGGDSYGRLLALGPDGMRCLRHERWPSVITADGDSGLPRDRPEGQPPSSPGGPPGGRLQWGYSNEEWVVRCVGGDADVARVPCEGWRRPGASWVAGPDALALAYVAQDAVHVYRRRPVPGSAAPARCLHPAHSGRELLCAKLLLEQGPACSGQSGSRLALLAGGEDCGLWELLAGSSSGEGGAAGAAFSSSNLLGEHAGMEVKALAVAELRGDGEEGAPALFPHIPPGHQQEGGEGQGPGRARRRQWLMVMAGVKQALLAWHLEWGPAEGRGAGLRCSWLALRPPPRGGFRRRATAQGDTALVSDQRYMSISMYLHQYHGTTAATASSTPALAFVLTAASDASLELLAFDPGTAGQLGPRGAWRAVASLRHHSTPVLCTAAVDAGGERLALSGGTDGAVAVWGLGDVTAAYIAACGAGGAEGWAPPDVAPLAVLPGVHQSGVNALSATVLGGSQGREVLLMTGGDDQAVAFTLLTLLPGPPAASDPGMPQSCSVAGRAAFPNAHGSAVRALWLAPGGGAAFSAGLDQRLRGWALCSPGGNRGEGVPVEAPAPAVQPGAAEPRAGDAGGVRVSEAGAVVTQVFEPAALDVAVLPPAGGGAAAFRICVVGRGAELLEWAAAVG